MYTTGRMCGVESHGTQDTGTPNHRYTVSCTFSNNVAGSTGAVVEICTVVRYGA